MRVAIAGLGAAARTIHLPAYRRIPRLEVVGGCDPTVAGKAATSFPFPTFADAGEMIDRCRPELLAVLTPPSSHSELARLGLEAGCHVLCEKPFVTDLDEGRRLVELARERGRWLVVNQQYRFMEVHRRSQEVIGGSDFGDLLFLDARQTFRTDAATEAGWRGRERRRTLQEFGTHVLDLCRFFFAAEPRRLAARLPRPGRPDGPDHLVLLRLDFPGDRVAQITLDRLHRGRHRYLELRLDGTIGTVESRLGGGLHLGVGVRGGSRRPYLELDVSGGGQARLYRGERWRKLAADPLDLFPNATRRLLEAFLDAVDRGVEPPCSAADNLRTVALMLAAYDADRRGVTVELGWDPWPSWRGVGEGGP